MKKDSYFGVYGVIFNKDKSKLLVIKKARGPYTGLYDLPGGGIEDGETLEEALEREILEETNCKVVSYNKITDIKRIYNYKDKKTQENCEMVHDGVLYSVSISGEPIEFGDGKDSNGCVWINISKINEKNSTPFVNYLVSI